MSFIAIFYTNVSTPGFKVGDYLNYSYFNAPVDENNYHWRYDYYNATNGKAKGGMRVRFMKNIPNNLTQENLRLLEKTKYSDLKNIKGNY